MADILAVFALVRLNDDKHVQLPGPQNGSPGCQTNIDEFCRGALLWVAGAALLYEVRHVRLAVWHRRRTGLLLPHLEGLRDLPGHHLQQQNPQAEDVDLDSTISQSLSFCCATCTTHCADMCPGRKHQ